MVIADAFAAVRSVDERLHHRLVADTGGTNEQRPVEPAGSQGRGNHAGRHRHRVGGGGDAPSNSAACDAMVKIDAFDLDHSDP